jgi:hypothetical protein
MLHSISASLSNSAGPHSEQSHPAPRITCKQGFYITLPILHGLSAIAALVICFHCNVGQMQHQARVPRAPGPTELGPALLPANFSQVKLFLAAYRWAEDAEFTTHTWNPFALTMVFQWLTAGFALRNVAPLANEGVLATVWYVWLMAGYAVFVTWSFVQTKAFCVAMFATVTVCFMASALICFLALGPPTLCTVPHGKKSSYEEVPQEHADARLSRINGRLWCACPLFLFQHAFRKAVA